MEIKVTTASGRVPVTIMHITGDLDSSSYMDFLSKAEELISGGASHVLVDLTHSRYVSSAGFRALHTLFNRLRALHPAGELSEDEVRKGISAGTYTSPHLKLLNLSKETKATFELTGFDMYIETFTDMKKAIAAF